MVGPLTVTVERVIEAFEAYCYKVPKPGEEAVKEVAFA